MIGVLAVSCAFCHAAENNVQLGYARSLPAGAGKDAQLRLVNDLDRREAFRIRTEKGKAVVEAATGAGFIYGVQALADEFLREMESSVKGYEKLAELTGKTYHFANGLRPES